MNTRPASWLKTDVPTLTVTGTVTLLPFAVSRILPLKSPATRPEFGNALATTPMVITDAAVPLVSEAVNHAPPSDVVVVSDQPSVPAPPFLICNACETGSVRLGCLKKLRCPWVSSKNAVPGGATVRMTGTVMAIEP